MGSAQRVTTPIHGMKSGNKRLTGRATRNKHVADEGTTRMNQADVCVMPQQNRWLCGAGYFAGT
jgi:hypothetical protein